MIKQIKKTELLKAFDMQKKCFKPIYEKYQDKINPCKESFIKFISRTSKPNFKMYWIVVNNIKVGQIWVATKNETAILARVFVLPKYQNKGYATKAIIHTEKIYSQYNRWWLDTIKQERLHFVGVDMLSYLYSNKLNMLNKREFEEYMKFLSVICEREDLVGFSQHMLDVFRKN